MKKFKYLFIITSIIFYFISLIIFIFDKNFSYRWLNFYLSIIPVLLIFLLELITLFPYKKIIVSINFYSFFIIFLFAVISRLIFLKDYPFVSVGDELRDGGLNAQEILMGSIKNIFGYGRYDAHGLIIPTFTSVFYKFFGNSVFVYRLPSALISILDISFLYLLLFSLTKNALASFFGSLSLIALPLHLYYSRTEVVVILNSFFSTLILLSLFIFFRRKMANIVDYLFLGTLLGFSFNFHASIKSFSLITLLIIMLIIFFQKIMKKINKKQFMIRLLSLIFFLIVGFGPRLFNTLDIKLFLHTSRLPFFTEKKININHKEIKNIQKLYLKSLLVWIKEPTNSWYPDHKPILSPLLFFLMVLGVVICIIKKNFYLITIIFITLLLHLTNSSLTDIINADHRLSPLYPIGPIYISIGVAFFMKKIKIKSIQYLFAFMFFIFLSYQILSFFIDQPANKNKDIGDYLSMHTIYFIKDKKLFNHTKIDNLNFLVSPSNYQKFNYLHYKEQYAFFLPKTTITIKKDEKIKDNEIYIKNNEDNYLGKSHIIKCNRKNYYCPINHKDNIVINY